MASDLWDLADEAGLTGASNGYSLPKHPENLKTLLPANWLRNPPPYVRFGVTGENQQWPCAAGFLNCSLAGFHFLSVEPMLAGAIV
jgi:hypothetical protein